jgi:outer membrane lipoprotein-sorting protein
VIDDNLNPQRVNIEDAKGQKISVTYTNVRRDAIPDSTFEFAPPPGAKVSAPLGS